MAVVPAGPKGLDSLNSRCVGGTRIRLPHLLPVQAKPQPLYFTSWLINRVCWWWRMMPRWLRCLMDREQLQASSHWDIAFIRRFMLLFGPISSMFDFATFGLMLFVFNAAPGEFRAGWFIESIATQTLIIFAIRTRRVPFLRSRPSAGLLWASLGVVALGIYLPLSPVGPVLGLDPLPVPFFLALLAMTVVYLVLVELAKGWFFSRPLQRMPAVRHRGIEHHVHRRAARFSVPEPLVSPRPASHERHGSGLGPLDSPPKK